MLTFKMRFCVLLFVSSKAVCFSQSTQIYSQIGSLHGQWRRSIHMMNVTGFM